MSAARGRPQERPYVMSDRERLSRRPLQVRNADGSVGVRMFGRGIDPSAKAPREPVVGRIGKPRPVPPSRIARLPVEVAPRARAAVLHRWRILTRLTERSQESLRTEQAIGVTEHDALADAKVWCPGFAEYRVVRVRA